MDKPPTLHDLIGCYTLCGICTHVYWKEGHGASPLAPKELSTVLRLVDAELSGYELRLNDVSSIGGLFLGKWWPL